MNLLSWNMFASLLWSYFFQELRIHSLNSAQKSHVLYGFMFNKPSFPSSLCFKPSRLVPSKEAFLEVLTVGVLGQPFLCTFPAAFTSSEVGCSNLQLENTSCRTPEPNSACVYHCPGAGAVLEWGFHTFFALGEGEEGMKICLWQCGATSLRPKLK